MVGLWRVPADGGGEHAARRALLDLERELLVVLDPAPLAGVAAVELLEVADRGLAREGVRVHRDVGERDPGGCRERENRSRGRDSEAHERFEPSLTGSADATADWATKRRLRAN